jgi:hypothetical protein
MAQQIIGAVLQIVGAYGKVRAAQKRERAHNEAIRYARKLMSPEGMSTASKMYFPGLLPNVLPHDKGIAPETRWDYLRTGEQNPMTQKTFGQAGSPQGMTATTPEQPSAAPLHGGIADTTLGTTTPAPVGGATDKSIPSPTQTAAPSQPSTTQPTTRPQVVSNANITPGGLVTSRLMDQLYNPGQLEDITYQRGQEAANRGLNVATAATQGQLTGLGIDPRSGIGQSAQASNVLNYGKEVNEITRDYSLAKEAMRRQDIQQGMDNYLNFLGTLFGIQRTRAGAAGEFQAGAKAQTGGEGLSEAGQSVSGGGMGGGGGGAGSGGIAGKSSGLSYGGQP